MHLLNGRDGEMSTYVNMSFISSKLRDGKFLSWGNCISISWMMGYGTALVLPQPFTVISTQAMARSYLPAFMSRELELLC